MANHCIESLTQTKSTIKKYNRCVPTMGSLMQENIASTTHMAQDSVTEVAKALPEDAAIKAVDTKKVVAEEATTTALVDAAIKAVVPVEMGMVETNLITRTEITTIQTTCIVTCIITTAATAVAVATAIAIINSNEIENGPSNGSGPPNGSGNGNDHHCHTNCNYGNNSNNNRNPYWG